MRVCQCSVRTISSVLLIVSLFLSLSRLLPAQLQNQTNKTNAGLEQGNPNNSTPPDNPLANQQLAVAEQFKKLEALLLKSAELEAADNPARAALLQQAAQLGKQSQLTELLARAAKSLEQKQYSQAIEDQKSSRDSLKRLLELLQSENRHERIREQKEEVRRWIEETDRLLRLQISQRGRTEGGQDSQQAAKDQGKLSEKAQDILQGMKGSDSPDTDSTSDPAKPDQPNQPKGEKSKSDNEQEPTQPGKQPDDDKNGGADKRPNAQESQKAPSSSDAGKKSSPDSKSPSQMPPGQDQSQPDDQKAPAGQPQPNDARPQPSPSQSPQQTPSESSPPQPNSDSQQDKSPSSSAPQDPQQRAKQRIQSANQKMKDAQQKLEQADREGAVEKQLEAEEQLRAAIEELEEILRQMREEEIERSLAAVDTRLRRMLEMQTKVLEETKRLQAIGGEKVDRQIEIRASNLSLEERKILAESERVQLLLREEGSSVAFPEAISQMTTDIQSVVDRLAKGDVGKMTVAIEQEIVTALEEMIAALAEVQKEQKERQQQQSEQSQQPPPPSGEQPLVNKLAELRLIRTLQVRVNKRTNILSEMLQDPSDPVGQAEANDILLQLRELAQRQSSVQRVTRDIVVGKSK